MNGLTVKLTGTSNKWKVLAARVSQRRSLWWSNISTGLSTFVWGSPLLTDYTIMANKADNCTTGYLVNDLQPGTDIKLPEGVTLETIEDIGYGQGVNFWLSPGDVVEFPAKDKLRIDVEKFKKLNGDYGYTLVARVWISSYDDYTWMPLSILRRIPCNDYREYLTREAQEALLDPMKGKSEAEITAFIAESGFKVAEDGRLYRLINEEREFFATYPLGRELAARNKSDLGVYREMAGRTIEVEDVKLLHKHEFGYDKVNKKGVRLNTFTGIFCYRFREISSEE